MSSPNSREFVPGFVVVELGVVGPASITPGVVHASPRHASMPLHSEPGAASSRLALQESRAEHITFDPNIQPALMPPHPEALRVFEATAALATAVKMSDQDAAWLYPHLSPDEVIDIVLSHGLRLVAITMGSEAAIRAAGPQPQLALSG